MSELIKKQLSSLSDREKRALNEVVSILYFNDRSDYLNGLWGVVDTLLGDSFDEDFKLGELRKLIKDAL